MLKVMIYLNCMAAFVILGKGLFLAINSMNRHTAHGIRLSWIAMSTGSLGILLGPLFKFPQPGFFGTMLHVGFAAYLLFDRRLCDKGGWPL